MTLTATQRAWKRGTVVALERMNNGASSGNGIVTPAQTIASLQQENAHLQHMLELARERIRELEALHTEPEDLVTMSAAADIMHVHPATISRWVAAGNFSLRYIGGRKKPMIVRSSLHKPARKKRSRKA